ncbi:hypothetical protein RJ641_001600 [Dillenia turbinata]|uniref:Uncharacterized protein n=1 Tax=Dillenia turbinata TaxID=194707 RepID=A0AAN8VLL0_9MAGN
MCTSKSKMEQGLDMNPKVVHIDGRPVLQPTSNRVPIFEQRASFKKASSKFPNSLASSSNSNTKTSPPLSPKLKSPRTPARKMKIAHYGRTKSDKYEGKVVPLDSLVPSNAAAPPEEKICSLSPRIQINKAFRPFDKYF